MYDILFENTQKLHEYEELIKAFLRPEDFRIVSSDDELDQAITFYMDGDKNHMKRKVYEELNRLTGKNLPWGIITGIRPVKLTGEYVEKYGVYQTKMILRDFYYVSPDKIKQAVKMYVYQRQIAGIAEGDSAAVYIGIPFCPSRCLYCSFTSNKADKGEMDRYLEALFKEIDYVSGEMKKTGIYAESVYIGGGTPTALTKDQLKILINKINKAFGNKQLKEFSAEAGRPDTIDSEKLHILKEGRVNRISINPQTMKDETLKLIGRDHSGDDVKQAFSLAYETGIELINTDIIAGLPGEDLNDFKNTLEEIIKLDPENVTVHTLAVKRSSRLKDIDKDFHYKKGDLVNAMLDYAEQRLDKSGYVPYYLYRQKHMAGGRENIGYSKPGHECIYNIRIMEERQNVIALGAGGISKAYYPKENRHERIPNVSNYEIYISRIEEMCMRKGKELFRR